MRLDHLSIVNYRNIREADVTLSPGFNCLVGPNGAGKTNALDAIYLLSFCKSYFGAPDGESIRHGEALYMVQGRYTTDPGLPTEVHCGCKRGGGKQFRRDRKEYERLSDHIGQLPLVIITPSDDALIGESPETRRRYADQVISQCDRPYMEALMSYGRALAQRNALLKQLQEGAGDERLLDLLDEQLARPAHIITAGRRRFTAWLAPAVADTYAALAGDDQQAGVTLATGADRYDWLAGLRDTHQRDIAAGFTTRGTHRDDLAFTLGGYPMRREASQGQRKSFVLALKLAQYHFLAEATGKRPMLLLDDIFDKLDRARCGNLLDVVGRGDFGQVVLTDTDRARLEQVLTRTTKPRALFNVARGTIDSAD